MSVRGASARKRIGLFGGSFDPPHLGHALATLWVLGTGDVDEVWWVPTFRHAHGKDLLPFSTRFALCQTAVRHLRGVRVEPIESELGGESRTIDTIEALGVKYPEVAPTIIIGSDLVSQIDTWKRADELRRYPIVVVPRGAVAPHVALSIPDISSSALRRALSSDEEDQAALSWLDAEVRAMIDASGLYRARED